MRLRRDKSTKFFTEIKAVSDEGKKWKKTEDWKEPWF